MRYKHLRLNPVCTSRYVLPLYICAECRHSVFYGGAPRRNEQGRPICPLCYVKLARIVW